MGAFVLEYPNRIHLLGNARSDGKIILNLMLKNLHVKVWTGL